ncbi:MAG TPA: RES family NAD+ phosphorylase [Nocardioides sp.]|uniref:RES family NAD+ phosphorylase n=1 Tax=uncultured Nocardioides sp. TaxID=198441 RepID=UPI000ECD060B|nr:RES family NAD+ phosphorylase [uncultured Nocardioides sp.]HCB05838.1 hypothetical protein [Nocardioides sp.]HRD62634.1 RES family NAD+ phosphorylase [Nocardioides sp.]HRI98161.1 RES family NAD+ phosphorylase [Nocardioides sp.]HRK48054.1 RES family NAD+ phosphorylase [Nocardioides sp.]
MILYRVFPYLETAKPGEAGSPTYVHRPQGGGRLDNPSVYDAWYFGLTPEAAVGESFGDLAMWRDGMFRLPVLKGSRKVLGVYEVDDTIPVLDMDDAKVLLDRHLRPTQVVARNYSVTQGWGLQIHHEGRWAGVRWWSYQRPHWTVYCLWVPVGDRCPARFVDYEELHLGHRSVVDAAHSLERPIVR